MMLSGGVGIGEVGPLRSAPGIKLKRGHKIEQCKILSSVHTVLGLGIIFKCLTGKHLMFKYRAISMTKTGNGQVNTVYLTAEFSTACSTCNYKR